MSRRSESTRIFVGNLPRDIREKELDKIFGKYGRIRAINIRSSRNQGPCFAFLDFDDHRDAEDAIKYRDGYDYDGYRIRVEYSNSAGDRRNRVKYSPVAPRRNQPRRSAYRVHVSGLPTTGSWQDLKDHMRKSGEVVFADVYKDGTGVVEFATHQEMKNAINDLQGSTFRSRDKESTTIELREDNDRSRSASSRHSRDSRRRSRSRSSSRSRSRSRSVSHRNSRSKSESR